MLRLCRYTPATLGLQLDCLSCSSAQSRSTNVVCIANVLHLVQEGVDGFLEESIVRRELSDNYVFYEKNYDKFEAAAEWAKISLDKHRDDEREYTYTL